MMDTETGELVERRLEHANGEARAFYASLPKPVLAGGAAFEPVLNFRVAHLSRCVTGGAFDFGSSSDLNVTYDSSKNLLSESTPLDGTHTATTSYTYNSFGEVLTLADPLGYVTTNVYDMHGKLPSVTSPACPAPQALCQKRAK
jgi:hypothetical protein